MKKYIIVLTTIINLIIIYLSYPFFYSNDGAAYLSSARSIFKSDANLAYEWLREPGYPLILKYINEIFGKSGNNLIILQSLFLVISLTLVAHIFEKKLDINNVTAYWLLIGIFSFFSQIYFQYSSLVLQQSLFALYLAIYCLSFYLINKNYIGYIILFFLFIFTLNTSIIFYYFNLIIIFIIIVKIILNRKDLAIKILFVTVLLFTNIFAIRPWENYKQENIATLKIDSELQLQFAHTSGKTNFFNGPKLNSDFIKNIFSFSSLNNFKQMVYSGKEKSENLYFMNLLLSDTFTCGGNVASEAIFYRNYSQFYFDYSCKNIEIRNNLHKKLTNYYFLFYSTILIMFVFAGLFSLMSKKFFELLSIPFLFMFLYIIPSGIVDRYFIPTFPFALAFVTYSLICIFLFIKNKILRNKPV